MESSNSTNTASSFDDRRESETFQIDPQRDYLDPALGFNYTSNVINGLAARSNWMSDEEEGPQVESNLEVAPEELPEGTNDGDLPGECETEEV